MLPKALVALAASAVVFGLVALITGATGAATVQAVFLGLWMMAVAGVLCYLVAKS